MTIRIVSSIHKSKLEPGKPRPWIVSSSAFDDAAEPSRRYIVGASDDAICFEHAIAIASEQRHDIDSLLMDSVYRERLARREAVQS